MRILVEAGDLNPPFVEGTRNIVMAHVGALLKNGHNVVILTKKKETNTGKVFKSREKKGNLEYYRWSNYLELFLAFRKIARSGKIDAIHVFAKGLRPLAYMKFIRRAGAPVVFTILGYPFDSGYGKKDFRKFSREVDLLTATSKTIFADIKSACECMIEHIPFGIDAARYSGNIGNGRGVKIIGLRKSLPEVLDAFREVVKMRRNAELVISDVPKSAREKKLIDGLRAKGAKITEVGLLEDIREIMKSSPIVLELDPVGKRLPSASPPLLMIEAMASGARVVATDIPELREVIDDGKTGILIKENTASEILGGIRRAMKNTGISRNASKKANLDYNIQKNIKRFEEAYKKPIQLK